MNQVTQFDLTQTKFWTFLHTAIKWLMIICCILSTACMAYAVIKRYVFKGNFYGSDEIIMVFAFWLYFMGAVYGSFENSHLKADLLSVYLHNIRTKDFMELVAEVCTIVINVIVLVWAVNYIGVEIGKWALSTGLKIPLVIPKSAMLVGFALMAFYHIYYFISHVTAYIKQGFFSELKEGDYISDHAKEKYPTCTLPTKSQWMENKKTTAGGEC